MATFAVIGGIDLRPRIGGMVRHDEFGLGRSFLENRSRFVEGTLVSFFCLSSCSRYGCGDVSF